jgi:glycosyltransferase involved in cell wall biosynthesis
MVHHAPRRLKIDWIIPQLIIGGGGHRNILRAAHHLQSFGHDVALHFTNSDGQSDKLRGLLHQHFYPFEGEVKAYDGQFRETDVIFATHWTTVDAALRAKDRTKEIMYFVQDYEPSFAPMGSEYVLAENTYRLGLYCITSGPWCEVVLKRDFGAEADHFKFPIDTSIYKPRARNKANTNIVFFAKPEMPRRCFELGALALEHVHRARPDIEIIMFGSSRAKEHKVNYPVTYLEMVPTIEDLSQMYANADLGIVFSTTNPSLVPFEMMASGCPVVDLRRPGNEVNYDDRTDIALLADPMPEYMAQEILALLADPEDMQRRRDNGLQFTKSFPSEEEMALRIEELICARMASISAGT